MQEEYQRLIENLSVVDEPLRSELIKAVSATKTALESLDNAVLHVSAISAVESFERVVASVNKLIEELLGLQAPVTDPFDTQSLCAFVSTIPDERINQPTQS